MTSLPTDAEIRARLEQLHLLEPGAVLPPDLRRSTAKLLQTEREAAAQEPERQPMPLEPVLLSRLTQPAAGGMLRVDVLFIPTPNQEGPTS